MTDSLRDGNILLEEATFPTVFFMYKVIGLWRPTHLKNTKKWIFNTYTMITICLMISLNAAEVLYLVFNVENIGDALLDDLCQIMARVHVTFRILVIISKRDKIITLLKECVTKRWNDDNDEMEITIRRKCLYKTRMMTIVYTSIAWACALALFVRRIIDDAVLSESKLQLPIDTWYPYDVEVPFNFWITYVHQMISALPFVISYSANACFLSGFMLQISTQLDMLKCRIGKMLTLAENKSQVTAIKSHVQTEKKLIVNCLKDHKCILSFTNSVNATFSQIQFVFFFETLFEICTTVYQLSQQPVCSVGFFMITCFLGCTVCQVFMFCWIGNEIILSSQEVVGVIASIDWLSLKIGSRKLLLIMMTCMAKPIQLYCGPVIVWNISCFINVIKASYSVLNVLKHTAV